MLEGTLVAIIIYKNKFYLLSDGRVVNSLNKRIVSESFSKLHKLTKYSALVSIGRYLPNLVPEIIKKCEQKNIVCINSVTEIAKIEMEKQWREHLIEIREKGFQNNRLFSFILGYSINCEPNFYYIDNQTTPPFQPIEHKIQQGIMDITCFSHDSDRDEVAKDLCYFLGLEEKMRDFELNAADKIYNAFRKTQIKVSSRNQSIGGNTFMAILDFENGYQLIR